VHLRQLFLLLIALLLVVQPARAESPAEWIELGTRVHGGFGSYIPLGIRIGLDALTRLHAKRRGVSVIYQSGRNAPCDCIVDGIALATVASMGQRSVVVRAPSTDARFFGSAVVTDKISGRAVRYTIPSSAEKLLDKMNQHFGPRGRYDAVMALPAAQLFIVSVEPTSSR
jgi:formylmethanofuran dehydrogenase subunit E